MPTAVDYLPSIPMLPSSLTATVSVTKQQIDAKDKRPHTLYVVNLSTTSGYSWSIQKRFSEFIKLGDDIKKLNKTVASRLPSRLSILIPHNNTASLIQQRTTCINEFLKHLLAEPSLIALQSVRLFFNMDAELRKANDMNQSKPDDFNFIKLIGKGTFATVYQAEHLAEHKIYAVKVIDKKSIVEKQITRYVMAERSVLQQTRNHPFLVQLHYAFHTMGKLYLVLEYVNGGELAYHLKRSRFFKLERARFYAAEIASALGYLHEQHIIYRDLKPENVLLDSEGHVVLTDFGLCLEADTAKTFCGTAEYMAPEVLRKKQYTRAVDWWCLGCMLFEMLSGFAPFIGGDGETLNDAILHEHPELPKYVAPCEETEHILEKLLDKNWRTRLGSANDFQEVKSHPFFSSIDWPRLETMQLTPPFKPNTANSASVENIDDEFTAQDVPDSVRQGRASSDCPSFSAEFSGFAYAPISYI